MLMNFSPAMSMHNHSISETWETHRLVSRIGSHVQMWLDYASAKFRITSLSTQVQWVFWRRMARARHSTMLILLAVVPSMFSWSTAGYRYFAKCPEKGGSLHSNELY